MLFVQKEVEEKENESPEQNGEKEPTQVSCTTLCVLQFSVTLDLFSVAIEADLSQLFGAFTKTSHLFIPILPPRHSISTFCTLYPHQFPSDDTDLFSSRSDDAVESHFSDHSENRQKWYQIKRRSGLCSGIHLCGTRTGEISEKVVLKEGRSLTKMVFCWGFHSIQTSGFVHMHSTQSFEFPHDCTWTVLISPRLSLKQYQLPQGCLLNSLTFCKAVFETVTIAPLLSSKQCQFPLCCLWNSFSFPNVLETMSILPMLSLIETIWFFLCYQGVAFENSLCFPMLALKQSQFLQYCHWNSFIFPKVVSETVTISPKLSFRQPLSSPRCLWSTLSFLSVALETISNLPNVFFETICSSSTVLETVSVSPKLPLTQFHCQKMALCQTS